VTRETAPFLIPANLNRFVFIPSIGQHGIGKANDKAMTIILETHRIIGLQSAAKVKPARHINSSHVFFIAACSHESGTGGLVSGCLSGHSAYTYGKSAKAVLSV
jgi:hypothetical protein